MPSFDITLNTASLDGLVDSLADDIEAAARPAAQAGAQVLYDAVQQNVARIGRVTGNLSQSIYQAFSEDNSRPGVATYHVSWNARKAPHGHLVEFGHIQKFAVYLGKDGKWYTNKRAPLAAPIQVGARPFIRPAMAQFDKAEAAMRVALLKRLERSTA